MKTLYESLLDDEETLIKNTELTDLYSLIKDKIKAMSYVYFSLGYTHGFDTKKCLKLASKDEVLKTINGKTMNPGGTLGKIMPIFLKQIIVNPQFITHNFDESYMKSSAEQTFNYVVANDLRNHKDLDRAYTGTQRFPYFYVEMRNGALYIYYDWGAKPDTSKGFSSERGNGRIIIRF